MLDDRDRVGRGNERAEDDGMAPTEPFAQAERRDDRLEYQCRQADGRDHAGNSERGDRHALAPEVAELQVKGSLEQQPWQEHRVQQLLGQLWRFEQPQDAEDETGDHESHRVRQPEPARGNRDRRRDDEEQYETSRFPWLPIPEVDHYRDASVEMQHTKKSGKSDTVGSWIQS